MKILAKYNDSQIHYNYYEIEELFMDDYGQLFLSTEVNQETKVIRLTKKDAKAWCLRRAKDAYVEVIWTDFLE